jgi:hypothetical protein
MNFDDAIQAHAAWKMKLSNYIRSPDDSLNPDMVCKDDQCALGKWIHGEGSLYSAEPEFGFLKGAHADFHKEAAEIIRRAKRGEKVTDEMALGAKSKFAENSNKVVTHIRNLRNKVKAA